jgi:hypothetical protein
VNALKKDEGARYAIEVDGVVRTHRDDVAYALDAAVVLRSSPGGARCRYSHLTHSPRWRSTAPGRPVPVFEGGAELTSFRSDDLAPPVAGLLLLTIALVLSAAFPLIAPMWPQGRPWRVPLARALAWSA